MFKNKQTKMKKNNKNCNLFIIPQLLSLKEEILNGKVQFFQRKTKSSKENSSRSSNRRSRYIGVSKNNFNWQALINVKNVKKYIGTFVNEEEAARMYDLYNIAIKGKKAVINFDYTPEQLIYNIDYFIAHQKIPFSS